MKYIILLLLGIVFSSCMHVGMMGSGDAHHSGTSPTTESVLVKETTFGDIKAVATFTPLQMDEDVVQSLKLMDARTSQPISGAKVYFHALYMHTVESAASHNHPQSNRRPESEHEINIDQVAKESNEAGVYSIPYGSSQLGEHTLMFHIAAIGDRQFDPELVIEATRTLAPQSHEHSGGMMGMSGTTTYIVLGAVVMSAMMVLMLSRGAF